MAPQYPYNGRCLFFQCICGKTLLLLLVFWLFPLLSLAEESEIFSVSEKDGEYRLHIVDVIDAPANYVHRVITDYRHAYRINPAVTEVEILPSYEEAVTRVHNHSEHWFGPFCLSIDWVGDIIEVRPGELHVVTVPELSSFESGYAYWRIDPEGLRTRVIHESSLKPKFFVPPLIGSLFMKKYLQEHTLETFRRIECNARILLERDMENDTEYLISLMTTGKDCSDAVG